jgi:hypothetical protein
MEQRYECHSGAPIFLVTLLRQATKFEMEDESEADIATAQHRQNNIE